MRDRRRRVLLLAALGLPLVAATLRICGFRATRAALRALSRAAPRSGGRPADPEELARLVRVASRRGVVRVGCLSRGLLVWAWLTRQGHAARLRVGVAPRAGRLAAHAWVELDGRALAEPPSRLSRFRAFADDLGAVGPRRA